MGKRQSFKFLDEDLNQQLIERLEVAKVEHFVDKKQVIHYSANDQEVVDNDLICSIRDKAFPSWQVLTCPADWLARYRSYMSRHDIPFREELRNGEWWFLLPRRYRPLSWKLDSSAKEKRLAHSQ